MWQECNYAVVWTFFILTFLWDWNESDLFQSCGHCWVFQICWHIECSTSTASSFRIWNSWNSITSTSFVHRRRQWHPTPVLLPGKSHEWRSLVGYSPRGREESNTTERLHFHFSLRTRLSNFTFTFHFHALEKEMATHFSALAWRIPWREEPGRLQFMWSQRVGQDWATSLSLSLGLEWKLTFSSPVAIAECSEFAGILSSVL